VINLDEMGGACSAYLGDVYRVLVGNLRERGHLGNPNLDGGIVIRCVFKKWDVGVWT
jgi:hypothetical protein